MLDKKTAGYDELTENENKILLGLEYLVAAAGRSHIRNRSCQNPFTAFQGSTKIFPKRKIVL